MELSIKLAQMIAVIYLAAGIGFLINGDYYRKMLADILDNAAVMYLSGVFALVLGMLMVWHHNIWEKDWTVLVTLVGWISLIKGLKFLLLPKTIKMYKSWLKPDNFNKIAWIPFVLGLIFAYFGFVQ